PAAVPELLVLALSSGLGLRVPQGQLSVLAFMCLEWRFRAPVRIGDTIRSRMRIAPKRELKAGGVVVEERAILNQRGEVVQEGKITLMVAKRGAA
ncbi:MAG: MaoC family dehydratase N-terminal domain-containing protein, partial [Candidatus Rokubacteria bacterium]|nr:MaoC family dehydratase N-terminal domain-containing protein [Candidatus Rokubacteria bacterium]